MGTGNLPLSLLRFEIRVPRCYLSPCGFFIRPVKLALLFDNLAATEPREKGLSPLSGMPRRPPPRNTGDMCCAGVHPPLKTVNFCQLLSTPPISFPAGVDHAPRQAHEEEKEHGVGGDLEVEVGQGMDEQGHDGSQAAGPEEYRIRVAAFK